jgi:hypothetical protein
MTEPSSADSVVALAALIRRGQLRLVDVPEAKRPLVAAVCQRLTDAQLAILHRPSRHPRWKAVR